MGATLLLLVVIEGGFRIKQLSDGRFTRPHPAPEAYRNVDWWEQYNVEYDASLPYRWRPYLYFGRKPSYSGKYINIDTAGRRLTPQPSTPAVPRATVYFFGGSTTWGDTQRDEFTIPAESARRLQETAGPGQRVEVQNFGEGGFVSTQGLIGLQLQLRNGNRPDVVVFYDGINDVVATVQAGIPGLPQNEHKRVAEFDMGRRLDRPSYMHSAKNDLKTVGWLQFLSLKQMLSVNWVLNKAPKPALSVIGVDSAARATVRAYVSNVRMVEALGREYGFTPIFVWQPTLQATPKTLTPFEARAVALLKSDSSQNRMLQVHRVVPAMLDSAMAVAAPGHFVNASGLFRGDTTNVFSDHVGHNTEPSIPAIVDTFWPHLKDAVSKRMKN